VGTTPRPTKHGFSGIHVRFLSRLWERRASLEKTLSLYSSFERHMAVRVRAPLLDFLQVARVVTDSLKFGPDLPGGSKVNDDHPGHSTHLLKLHSGLALPL